MVSVKLLNYRCLLCACACYAYAWVTCRSTQCISACIREVRHTCTLRHCETTNHVHVRLSRRTYKLTCSSSTCRQSRSKRNEKAGAICRHSKGGSKPWLIKGGDFCVCFLFHLLSIFFLLLSSPLLLLIFSTRTHRDTNRVIRETTNRLSFYRLPEIPTGLSANPQIDLIFTGLPVASKN